MGRLLDARPWVLTAADVTAAALFVVGCVAFYFPARFAVGVTLFLLGSLAMLARAVGQALRTHSRDG